MKTKLLLSLCAAVAIGGASCGSTQNQANNNAASQNNSHAGMNHGAGNTPANHQGMNHGGMNHSEMQTSPDAASAPFDLQFLDTMTAHHEGAVEMAKLAESKAGRAEIKTLAKNIIADQEKEIGQMKKWRNEWFPGKPAAINMQMAGMSDSMKGMDMNRLSSLSGNEFDLEFINQMIPHHEGALLMAQEALQKSQKAEIKTLSGAVVKSQEAEIKQMKDWQTAWRK